MFTKGSCPMKIKVFDQGKVQHHTDGNFYLTKGDFK